MGFVCFEGRVTITPPLEPERLEYLNAFCRKRHVRLDVSLAAELNDPLREAVQLDVGPQGAFVVAEPLLRDPVTGHERWHLNDAVIDSGHPADGVPGLWCDWDIHADRIEGDQEKEKWHSYGRWLRYLINTFLAPWGHTCDGEITFWDDDGDDGTLLVENNVVTCHWFLSCSSIDREAIQAGAAAMKRHMDSHNLGRFTNPSAYTDVVAAVLDAIGGDPKVLP